jgi:bifunctional DNA-binding transcriptional regulator/antitoxin component of YhaV-PrlF toxin-antitoxin module
MGRNRGDRTKLSSAKTMTDSLRTTVPSSIVRQMKLNAGDQLEWQIESLNPGIIRVSIVRSEKERTR